MNFNILVLDEATVKALNILTLDSDYSIGKIKEITDLNYDNGNAEDYDVNEFLSEILEFAAWKCEVDECDIEPEGTLKEYYVRVRNEDDMYWTMHIVYQENDGKVICVSYINGDENA